jgi:predicted membrane channel-forming protein YqfA (hemolysin III family)
MIGLFGLSYFSILAAQVLLFHFLPKRCQLLGLLSVIVFSIGVIIWCLSTVLPQVMSTVRGSRGASWQKFELASVLVLIWASTLPTIALLFEGQPLLQSGYFVMLTITCIGGVFDTLSCNPDISAVQTRFPYHCVSLGLLCLAPAIQALTETRPTFPTLATDFIYMAFRNSLGAAFYLIGPLERSNGVFRLRPSLYVMHLVIICSLVSYSRALMKLVL